MGKTDEEGAMNNKYMIQWEINGEPFAKFITGFKKAIIFQEKLKVKSVLVALN